MAILHAATITPTKGELITPWLRTRTWWDGEDEREPVGTFRLDDPAGQVGIECFLFGSTEGTTLFVPVTYRGAELEGGEQHLIGTMTHSVLGDRWVYDACGDPVFVSTLVETIRTGGTQAELEVHQVDGTVLPRETTAHARGFGDTTVPSLSPGDPVAVTDDVDRTVISAGELTVTVARRVGTDLPAGPGLIGSFEGGTDLALAAVALTV